MATNAFDMDGETVVVHEFTYAGVAYKTDDVFPHKALGVIAFSLKGLWMAGHLRFSGKPASMDNPKRAEQRKVAAR